jgi:hypothetical protein
MAVYLPLGQFCLFSKKISYLFQFSAIIAFPFLVYPMQQFLKNVFQLPEGTPLTPMQDSIAGHNH